MTISSLLAALLLLIAPGPTNVLLATGGALEGWRRALRLVPAVLAAYLGGVTVLALGLGPVMAGHPWLSTALKVLCSAVVALIALRLWRAGGVGETGHVTMGRVLAATAANPKVFVFAFAFLPPGATTLELTAALPALAILVTLSSTGWVAAGAALGSATRRRTLARGGAVALALCAALLSGSALG